ncbi:hypothetical protein [Candidatus Regiella endosymbiont of Tuberolachnus salignus]|uniref:hypothetical protein n=1 Tax=Candidatus Regiella endosymbiont of Tuberolachnus salignus TaxID=3077956 RepID=UPI0030D108CF
MSDKYELIDPQEIDGVTFYRIRALKYFGTQCPGSEGGLIEKAANLSQTGLSWVGYNSRVYGDACIGIEGGVM